MQHNKISIIGVGNIGSNLAQLVSRMNVFHRVCIFDTDHDTTRGKALDMVQSNSVFNHYHADNIFSCQSYAELIDSDIIVVTAGMARKPGMTREDLLSVNSKIIREIGRGIAEFSPKSFVIVVTNPVDSMAYLLRKVGDLLPGHVVGMSGSLDSARFRHLLSEALGGISPSDINCITIGSHNDQMVPLARTVNIAGVPLSDFISNGMISDPQVQEIIERTKNGGIEIVNLLKTGSAFFAPASCIQSIISSYMFDSKSVIPCSAYLTGQYGWNDIYAGVPAIIGSRGVEIASLSITLTADEQKAFDASLESIRKTNAILDAMDES